MDHHPCHNINQASNLFSKQFLLDAFLTRFLFWLLFVQIRFDVADRKTGVIVDRSLIFNIKIKDINDNAPEFPKKEFNVTVKENHKRGEFPQDD